MGSASEDIQDPNGDVKSKLAPPLLRNPSSFNVGLQSLSSAQQNNQVVSGDEHAPKVRKPYTITKQRERWTEEEHKKFLEALKLYGRAWRRIEEHVGTKTAVQIRSHAQKFFSKVVRESSSKQEIIAKPIEIPPPRPKRKPMHPYPRKLVSPVKTRTCVLDEHTGSASPNLSISGQENQSPTTVLSTLGSDATGVTDSNMPNGSLSPASSADNQPGGFFPSETIPSTEENGSSSPTQGNDSLILTQPNGLFPSEIIPSTEEDGSENGSSSPTQGNNNFTLTQDEQKLKLFSKDGAFAKEGSTEVASTHSLKLFGKTVLVTGPSSPNSVNCKAQPLEETDKRSVQMTSYSATLGVRYTPTDAGCSWTGLSCGSPAAALYYMQFRNEISCSVEAAWTYYGGVSYPSFQLHNPVPKKEYVYSDANENQDEGEMDRSRTCPIAGSVDAGEDESSDTEAQGRQPFSDKEDREKKPIILGKPRDEVALQEQKVSRARPLKGFVPYKRCIAERDNSSTLTGEEREDQRMRLCL